MIVIKIFMLGGAVLYLNPKYIYFDKLWFTISPKTIKDFTND